VKSVVGEMPEFAVTLFDWTTSVWWLTQYEKYMEIKGIVEAVNSTEVSLSQGLLVNSLYELQAWCTSIVAKMENGWIIH
jgi:hypothetical protein